MHLMLTGAGHGGTLLTAAQDMDDLEDLRAPSNAIKLGFDLKRLINNKIGLAIQQGNEQMRKEAKNLHQLIDIFWSTKVTKVARVLLNERHFQKDKKLPDPDDIKKLNDYLAKEISALDFTRADFQLVARLVLAKLILYNRRRSGELEAVRLQSYNNRKQGVDDEGRQIMGSCSDFERRLLEDQDLMEVRGKTGRGVPVILPKLTKDALLFLCDLDVRHRNNIPKANVYIFARPGTETVIRGYNAVAKTANEAGLEKPDRITSTQLRKYMATVTQVLDLTEQQMTWVTNHLGHSMDVHKIYYRMTSDVLERSQVAKLLLLQDSAQVDKYTNKRLEDIQLTDVVFPAEQQDQQGQDPPAAEEVGQHVRSLFNTQVTGISESEPIRQEVLSAAEHFFDEEDDGPEVEEQPVRKKRRKPSQQTRQTWSKEEEDEVKVLFKECFAQKIRPSPKLCALALQKSKDKNGCIQHRSKDTLKKKVFRMIDSLL